MPTHRTITFALAAAACMTAGLMGVAGSPGSRLTDDRTIDVPRDGAAAREVLWTPARPVDGAVNSSVDEYEPRVSGDGTTLVFVRRRPGGNADLFASRWTPAGWSEPAPIEAIDTERDELGPELSRDGTRLYFYSDREGGLGGYDLWVSEREDERSSWAPPTNLGPSINSAANEYGPGLTPDGSRLYFATNRPRPDERDAAGGNGWSATLRERRSRHDYDIYVAEATASGWSDAKRVEALSTGADDGSPAVSPAGDFLYFASDREGGSGGYDLYRLRLAPSGDPAPDAVSEALGDAINSGANELDPGLASEGFRIYFSTDRSSAGGYELFTSVSREVHPADGRAAPSVASGGSSWWSDLWPWLLLVALLGLLAWLLALLIARHDAWRRRIGQMSLLAQCLLLSLLLHLLVATLLAAWKVGGIVADRIGGGGHRVMLASAPRDDAAGDVAHQIRGEPAESAIDPATFRVAAATAPEATPTVTDPTPLAPDPMVRPPVPSPTSEAQPETMTERAALMALVAAAHPAFDPTAPSAPAPSAATEATAVPLAVGAMTPAALSAPPAAAIESRALEAPAPTLSSIAPPTTAPATTTESAANGPVMATALPRATASDSPAATMPAAARPAVPATGEPAREASLPSAVSQAAPLVPSRPGDAPIAPQAPSSAELTIAPSPVAPSAMPTSELSSTADSAPSAAVSMSAPSPSSPAATDAPRIPAAPAPLEDFAQRDPSIRSELLERMGGNDETERAVGLALEWLKRRQAPDGHWSSRDNEAEVDADAAMTGLALLCFLGAGHTHQEEGPYRETVGRGLHWLADRTRADGDLRGDRARPGASDTMYGQTIATVALCEAYAMTRDASLAPTVRRAIDFVLVRAAAAERGAVAAQDSAVLGWLVMAVESARRAGFAPRSNVFDAAREWLDRVSVSRLRGRYAYQPGERASAAMTAEAMFVQQLLGHAATEQRMGESAEFIAATLPAWSGDAPTHHWYYATLALFQHQGEPWKRWNEALTRELLAHQRETGPAAGSWDPQDRWSRAGGRVYQTAVCTLSLEVYYRYRPTAPRPD